VTLDVFLNEIVWTEQEVETRFVKKIDHHVMNFPGIKKYDHVRHGEEVSPGLICEIEFHYFKCMYLLDILIGYIVCQDQQLNCTIMCFTEN